MSSSSPSPSPSPPPAPTERQKRRFTALNTFKPRSDPAARNNATKFPLDGVNLETVSEETLVSLLDTAPVLHSFGGTTIVRLSKNLVLKGGRHVPPSEARSMRLAAASGVPVPKVHKAFDALVRAYIVMDYVEGPKLSDVWADLSDEKKAAIAKQVAEIVENLQSYGHDEPGPIGGGRAVGKLFPDMGAGPFEDTESLETWFNKKLESGYTADAPVFKFSKLVLTHQNISPSNIILRESGEIVLLNWDCAGAYPPSFESATLDDSFEDFHSLVSKLLPDHSKEVELLRSIETQLKAPAMSLR